MAARASALSHIPRARPLFQRLPCTSSGRLSSDTGKVAVSRRLGIRLGRYDAHVRLQSDNPLQRRRVVLAPAGVLLGRVALFALPVGPGGERDHVIIGANKKLSQTFDLAAPAQLEATIAALSARATATRSAGD